MSQVSRGLLWFGGVSLLVVAGLIASWFILPIWKVEVSGSHQLRPRQIAKLANALPKQPWLWVTNWRAKALMQNPFVQSVIIEKQFPGRVSIRITERQAFALLKEPHHDPVVLARDGTILPGAKKPKLEIIGWGANRLGEALAALQELEKLKPSRLEFTPRNLELTTARGTIWADSLASLRKFGGNVNILGSRVNIHPWGISTKQ